MKISRKGVIHLTILTRYETKMKFRHGATAQTSNDNGVTYFIDKNTFGDTIPKNILKKLIDERFLFKYYATEHVSYVIMERVVMFKAEIWEDKIVLVDEISWKSGLIKSGENWYPFKRLFQYSGVDDKKGYPIWEWDTVRGEYADNTWEGQVEFVGGCFCMRVEKRGKESYTSNINQTLELYNFNNLTIIDPNQEEEKKEVVTPPSTGET